MKESKKEAQNEKLNENLNEKQESAVNSEDAAVASENSGVEKEAEKPAEMSDAEKIEALTKENAELKDQLLRRAADFDNYRKRMIKEKQDALDYGTSSLLKDLLESIDNFDRTLEASKTASDVQSIVDGIKMVNSSLVSMLENKYGLAGYGVAGDVFNPEEHEAIGSMQGPVAEPVLQAVYLKGYKLKNKIIRHAKVMVTMPDGSVKADDSAGTEKTSDAADVESSAGTDNSASAEK